MSLTANCPICDEEISLASDVEETEVIVCSGCSNRVVVASVSETGAVLEEAPAIEEDWGE